MTKLIPNDTGDTSPAVPAALDPAAVRRAMDLLEAIVADRSLLLDLEEDERRRLLIAAGRVSRPAKEEMVRLSRASRRKQRRERYVADCKTRAQAGIRQAREASVFTAPQRIQGVTTAKPRLKLENPRYCYVCKDEYRELHEFYDSMCEACADLNYAKRFQSAPLAGRVALITGARVKIGFQAALMLLRAGAEVIVTTRFPHDAAQRFAREPDFDAYADRLLVHGLDLRVAPSVEIFTRYLNSRLDRLDFLINNAAQTVRRPPAFYAHMLDVERRGHGELGAREMHLLRGHEACKAALERGAPALPAGRGDALGTRSLMPKLGLSASAALSQIPYAFDEETLASDLFPKGALDADLQQIDLRRENSWRLALADVPTAEMIEVQLVNSVAPFILCSKLKPLMLRQKLRDKHIVNVSAMEGQFARRTKTDKHPHTNMAKAALNMLTLTSAADYVEDGIHMNAVDTGWVTDEDPLEITRRKQAEIDFHPPLDIVDGAARILDPIFHGQLTGEHLWGKFLKDYKPASW